MLYWNTYLHNDTKYNKFIRIKYLFNIINIKLNIINSRYGEFLETESHTFVCLLIKVLTWCGDRLSAVFLGWGSSP